MIFKYQSKSGHGRHRSLASSPTKAMRKQSRILYVQKSGKGDGKKLVFFFSRAPTFEQTTSTTRPPCHAPSPGRRYQRKAFVSGVKWWIVLKARLRGHGSTALKHYFYSILYTFSSVCIPKRKRNMAASQFPSFVVQTNMCLFWAWDTTVGMQQAEDDGKEVTLDGVDKRHDVQSFMEIFAPRYSVLMMKIRLG